MRLFLIYWGFNGFIFISHSPWTWVNIIKTLHCLQLSSQVECGSLLVYGYCSLRFVLWTTTELSHFPIENGPPRPDKVKLSDALVIFLHDKNLKKGKQRSRIPHLTFASSAFLVFSATLAQIVQADVCIKATDGFTPVPDFFAVFVHRAWTIQMHPSQIMERQSAQCLECAPACINSVQIAHMMQIIRSTQRLSSCVACSGVNLNYILFQLLWPV